MISVVDDLWQEQFRFSRLFPKDETQLTMSIVDETFREWLYCSIYCSQCRYRMKVPNGRKKLCLNFGPAERPPKALKPLITPNKRAPNKRAPNYISNPLGGLSVARSLLVRTKLDAVFLLALLPCGHFLA